MVSLIIPISLRWGCSNYCNYCCCYCYACLWHILTACTVYPPPPPCTEQMVSEFATANPVPGSDDGTLRLAFSDLRQLLDLFTGWDWSAYLADYGKQHSAYLRVHHHTALNLLERWLTLTYVMTRSWWRLLSTSVVYSDVRCNSWQVLGVPVVGGCFHPCLHPVMQYSPCQ